MCFWERLVTPHHGVPSRWLPQGSHCDNYNTFSCRSGSASGKCHTFYKGCTTCGPSAAYEYAQTGTTGCPGWTVPLDKAACKAFAISIGATSNESPHNGAKCNGICAEGSWAGNPSGCIYQNTGGEDNGVYWNTLPASRAKPRDIYSPVCANSFNKEYSFNKDGSGGYAPWDAAKAELFCKSWSANSGKDVRATGIFTESPCPGDKPNLISKNADSPDLASCKKECDAHPDCKYLTFYDKTTYCSLFRVCTLGPHVDEPQTWQRTIKKSKCDAPCTCDNGTAATGDDCPSDKAKVCASCNTGSKYASQSTYARCAHCTQRRTSP